jgi:hypothetical protein
MTSVANEAASPLAAFKRIFNVRLLPVADGTKLVTLSGFALIAVQLVPFVLYSIKFDTPVTVSV